MTLIQQPSPLEQLHTIAIKKKDVGTIISVISFCMKSATLSEKDKQHVQDLLDFFKNVYQSTGAI